MAHESTGAAALVLACVAFLLAPPAAFAHRPDIEPRRPAAAESEPIDVGGPDRSRAFYGYLAAEETADVWRFSVESSSVTEVGVLVPVRTGTADFYPQLTVSGGGPPQTIGVEWDEERETFFEPFSAERFYRSGSAEVAFEPAETYELRLSAGQGAAEGPYVITFAGGEIFGGADIAETAAILPRIYLGLYGQHPARWGCIGTIALIVGVLAGVVWALRRRSGRGSPSSA